MKKPGSRFSLEVWRGQASRKFSLVTEEWRVAASPSEPQHRSKSQTEKNMKLIGLTVSELNAGQLSQLGIPYGLLVRAVNAASARSGLMVGDVIVGIGSEPLQSSKQLDSAIRAAKSSLPLRVIRDGVRLYIPLPIGGAE